MPTSEAIPTIVSNAFFAYPLFIADVHFFLGSEAETVGRCWPDDPDYLSDAVVDLHDAVLPLWSRFVWTSVALRNVRHHYFHFLGANGGECLVVAPFPIPACRVALANAGLRQGTPFRLASSSQHY